MRVRGKKMAIALVVLVLAAGAAYWYGLQLWGRHHFRAAQEALARRDFHRAGFHLKKCLTAWPRDPSVRLLAAKTARRRGDLDEARRELHAHEQQQGPEQERRRELDLLLVQQGDTKEADRLLDECVRDPQRPDAYLALEAVIEEKLKLLEQAHNAGLTLVEGPAGRERARAEQALALWDRVRQAQADQVQ